MVRCANAKGAGSVGLGSVLRRTSNAVRVRVATPRALTALAAVDHPHAAGVAGAIRMTVGGQLDGRAEAWVQRIDGKRSEYLRVHEPIGPHAAQSDPDAKLVSDAANGTSHRDWGTLQLLLARAVGPVNALELGASLGISGAYLGAVLALSGGGRLVSYEASPGRAARAAGCWDSLELTSVEVRNERFDPASSDLAAIAPIGLAYLDAHHEPQATLDFTESVLGHLDPHGVILFDDIRWSAGMQSAWEALRTDARVAVAIDLGRVGLCLYGAPSGAQPAQVTVASRLRGSTISASG